jgi:Leucine-rich repeat (LRR) protein
MTFVGDATAAAVASNTAGGHRGLRVLDLSLTKITDAALTRLAVLPSLEILGLANTKITDDGAELLGNAPRLREIDLRSTRTTESIARKLARPGLTIHR